MSSDRESGEESGDTSGELDMLDKFLVGPDGRLDTEEKYAEGLNDRPRCAIFDLLVVTQYSRPSCTLSQVIARFGL
jgi:hypothetical protein